MVDTYYRVRGSLIRYMWMSENTDVALSLFASIDPFRLPNRSKFAGTHRTPSDVLVSGTYVCVEPWLTDRRAPSAYILVVCYRPAMQDLLFQVPLIRGGARPL